MRAYTVEYSDVTQEAGTHKLLACQFLCMWPSAKHIAVYAHKTDVFEMHWTARGI